MQIVMESPHLMPHLTSHHHANGPPGGSPMPPTPSAPSNPHMSQLPLGMLASSTSPLNSMHSSGSSSSSTTSSNSSLTMHHHLLHPGNGSSSPPDPSSHALNMMVSEGSPPTAGSMSHHGMAFSAMHLNPHQHQSLYPLPLGAQDPNGSIKSSKGLTSSSSPSSSAHSSLTTTSLKRSKKDGAPKVPVRPVCQECGKDFSNQSALAKHKLTHSDVRRFSCNLCGKAFKRQDHLNGHMLTHRDKKPFECDVEGCDKTYCDARSLRRHKENHHSVLRIPTPNFGMGHDGIENQGMIHHPSDSNGSNHLLRILSGPPATSSSPQTMMTHVSRGMNTSSPGMMLGIHSLSQNPHLGHLGHPHHGHHLIPPPLDLHRPTSSVSFVNSVGSNTSQQQPVPPSPCTPSTPSYNQASPYDLHSHPQPSPLMHPSTPHGQDGLMSAGYIDPVGSVPTTPVDPQHHHQQQSQRSVFTYPSLPYPAPPPPSMANSCTQSDEYFQNQPHTPHTPMTPNPGTPTTSAQGTFSFPDQQQQQQQQHQQHHQMSRRAQSLPSTPVYHESFNYVDGGNGPSDGGVNSYHHNSPTYSHNYGQNQQQPPESPFINHPTVPPPSPYDNHPQTPHTPMTPHVTHLQPPPSHFKFHTPMDGIVYQDHNQNDIHMMDCNQEQMQQQQPQPHGPSGNLVASSSSSSTSGPKGNELGDEVLSLLLRDLEKNHSRDQSRNATPDPNQGNGVPAYGMNTESNGSNLHSSNGPSSTTSTSTSSSSSQQQHHGQQDSRFIQDIIREFSEYDSSKGHGVNMNGPSPHQIINHDSSSPPHGADRVNSGMSKLTVNHMSRSPYNNVDLQQQQQHQQQQNTLQVPGTGMASQFGHNNNPHQPHHHELAPHYIQHMSHSPNSNHRHSQQHIVNNHMRASVVVSSKAMPMTPISESVREEELSSHPPVVKMETDDPIHQGSYHQEDDPFFRSMSPRNLTHNDVPAMSSGSKLMAPPPPPPVAHGCSGGSSGNMSGHLAHLSTNHSTTVGSTIMENNNHPDHLDLNLMHHMNSVHRPGSKESVSMSSRGKVISSSTHSSHVTPYSGEVPSSMVIKSSSTSSSLCSTSTTLSSSSSFPPSNESHGDVSSNAFGTRNHLYGLSDGQVPVSPSHKKVKHKPGPIYIPPHVNAFGLQSRPRSPSSKDVFPHPHPCHKTSTNPHSSTTTSTVKGSHPHHHPTHHAVPQPLPGSHHLLPPPVSSCITDKDHFSLSGANVIVSNVINRREHHPTPNHHHHHSSTQFSGSGSYGGKENMDLVLPSAPASSFPMGRTGEMDRVPGHHSFIPSWIGGALHKGFLNGGAHYLNGGHLSPPPYTPPPMLSPFRAGNRMYWQIIRDQNGFCTTPKSAPSSGSGSGSFSFRGKLFNPPTPVSAHPPLPPPPFPIPSSCVDDPMMGLREVETPKTAYEPSEDFARFGCSPVRAGVQDMDESIGSSEVGTLDPKERGGVGVTDVEPHVNVGHIFQARIPEYIGDKCDPDSRYRNERADLVWKPDIMTSAKLCDEDLDSFLQVSCSSCVPGVGRNLEYAHHLLHRCDGNLHQALVQLLDGPKDVGPMDPLFEYHYPETDIWSTEEISHYHQALLKCDKDFNGISKEMGTKSVKQCIQFYYLWKKVCVDEYRKVRVLRRKREQESYYTRSSHHTTTSSTNNNNNNNDASMNDKNHTSSRTSSSNSNNNSCSKNKVSPSPSHDHDDHLLGEKKMDLTDAGSEPHLYGSDHEGIGFLSPPSGLNGFASYGDSGDEDNRSMSPSLNGDKEFPCKICGKIFSKVKSRSAHMRIHGIGSQ